jgi:hypothetical protein
MWGWRRISLAQIVASSSGVAAAFVLALTLFTTVPTAAQPAAQPLLQVDRCAHIASLVAATPAATTGRLFILAGKSWTEVTPDSWLGGAGYTIPNYHGERLAFIYLAPPSANSGRQFLSIRTVADAEVADHFVNLRKLRQQFGRVYFGTYQGYHLNGEAHGPLRIFHLWSDSSRSDEPIDTRQSWAFQHAKSIDDRSRRRVLAISFRTGAGSTCVPFILGPNIASPIVLEGAEDEDDILGQMPFIVEITEAKQGDGSPGRTFLIRSQPARTRK